MSTLTVHQHQLQHYTYHMLIQALLHYTCRMLIQALQNPLLQNPPPPSAAPDTPTSR
jgi:hypothetical protein